MQRTLSTKQAHSQALGAMIIHGRCQVLKLVAGSIIRELLDYGIKLQTFWDMAGERDSMYDRFPKSQTQTSQWISQFETFVDDLALSKALSQE